MAYKKKLLEQYKASQGIKSTKEEKIYMIDFVSWMLENQKVGENYAEFLRYLDFDFDDYGCAEVGKSELDTIIRPYRTTIITPYTEDLSKIESTRIINGQFKVIDSTPTILIPNDEEKENLKQIHNQSIETYMTQNPYSQSNIENWQDLHNSGSARIILGAYGSIHDRDIEEKIIQLRNIKEKMLGEVIEQYEESHGEYYYVIGSKVYSKKKYKTK